MLPLFPWSWVHCFSFFSVSFQWGFDTWRSVEMVRLVDCAALTYHQFDSGVPIIDTNWDIKEKLVSWSWIHSNVRMHTYLKETFKRWLIAFFVWSFLIHGIHNVNVKIPSLKMESVLNSDSIILPIFHTYYGNVWWKTFQNANQIFVTLFQFRIENVLMKFFNFFNIAEHCFHLIAHQPWMFHIIINGIIQSVDVVFLHG